jgi:hypothetical protein
MTTFNPGDWWPRDRNKGQRRQRDTRQDNIGAEAALSVALCVCFAALAPPALMPAVLAALLLVAAIAWVGVSLLHGIPPGGKRATSWDAALLCAAASLLLQVGWPAARLLP